MGKAAVETSSIPLTGGLALLAAALLAPQGSALAAPLDVSARLRSTPLQQQTVDCDLLPDTSNGPIVVVTQPIPGATLPAGRLTIQGAAFDCAADVGAGVDRVSIFLGRRDTGGVPLGEATLRGPSPVRVAPADQYSAIGWTLSTAVPLAPGQANELFVYARSDVSHLETVVTLPVRAEGTADTPAPSSTEPQVPTSTPDSPQGGGAAEPPAANPAESETPLANNVPAVPEDYVPDTHEDDPPPPEEVLEAPIE